jgi:hypothetical protein
MPPPLGVELAEAMAASQLATPRCTSTSKTSSSRYRCMIVSLVEVVVDPHDAPI